MILKRDIRDLLIKSLEKMINTVRINLILGKKCINCSSWIEFLSEIAYIADGKINFKCTMMNKKIEKALGVDKGPVILLGDKGEVRYTGSPSGEELKSFIDTLVMLSTKKHGLNHYVKDLRSLNRTVRIETIVTPSCPYCVHSVMIANKIAIASRGKVISDVINAYEFPEIAEKWSISKVPTTVLSIRKPYSGEVLTVGIPDEDFIVKTVIRKGKLIEIPTLG